MIRLFAVAIQPVAGLRIAGISSNGMFPCHSWAPSQPGTGTHALAAFRTGTRPRVR